MKRRAHLFEKIVTFENLLLAANGAMLGKRQKVSVAQFLFFLEKEILALQEELYCESYRPRPYFQFEIREPKPRKICSSDFRDRVVHHAICNFIEPIFENRAIYDSHACRVNKGSHLAVYRCQRFSREFKFYLKCDVRKFFESIDHGVLKKLLLRVIKDEKILRLLFIIIDHKVPGNKDGKGLPIGNLTSQYFANFYLDQLDHFLKDKKGLKGYVRYMDDFISFSNDKESLHVLLKEIEFFLKDKLELHLKDSATRIAPVWEGIPFLGFRVFPGMIRLKRENLVRMRRKIKRKESFYLQNLISEKELIQSVGSMIAHISHANSVSLRKKIFEQSLYMA